MPFIPFSSSNYKSSTSSSPFDQEGSNPIIIGSSHTNTNSSSNGNVSNNPNSTLNANGIGNSNNSSSNNSTNNSPLFPQGSFPLRRKTSVGNALFSLVNSIRQPTMNQSSSRQGLRRNSSSHSRSRSASISLSKQASNTGSERGRENNSSDDLNRAREEVERANPFQISLTPELVQRFEEEGTSGSRKENRSDPQLTTILSGGNADEEEEEEVEGLDLERQVLRSSELQEYTGLGFQEMASSGSRGNNVVNESPSRITNRDNSNDLGDRSISITNADNSAHNLFNPAAYNYSMANSQTIPNFRIYANGGIIGGPDAANGNGTVNIATIQEDANNQIAATSSMGAPSNASNNNTRTRGNTLRDELIQYEPVVMNSENNPTTGTVINNPINIEDSREDVILLDAPNGGAPVIISQDNSHSVQIISSPGEEGRDRVNLRNRVGYSVGNDEDERGVNSAGGTESATNTMYAATTTRTRNTATATAATNNNSNTNNDSGCDMNGFYSIRLTPSIDHSSTHPYMFFGPIVRKLKPGKSISIGRYTERSKKAATAASGSSEPVVFKSKVVSRKHAELTVDEKGRWYIQDVKSSSGTFLNHVRLSLPNTESPKVFLNDSDILQLGVDYRGGSEEMYRCVKVKIELNYSWKKRAAKFSKEAHEKLKQLTNVLGGNKEELTPCVICLDDIKPCQAVFMSSCSHSWHYRCIRPLLVKTYPQFLCPNCKAVCDLEADLEDGDGDDDGEYEPGAVEAHEAADADFEAAAEAEPAAAAAAPVNGNFTDEDLMRDVGGGGIWSAQ